MNRYKQLPFLHFALLALLLGTLLLNACTQQNTTSSISSTPLAVSSTAIEQQAAKATIKYAQQGLPYLRLDGEPIEVRGQCDSGSSSECTIAVFGRIVETVPAGAGGTPSETTNILPLWSFRVSTTSFEIVDSTAYPPERVPSTIQALPLIPHE